MCNALEGNIFYTAFGLISIYSIKIPIINTSNFICFLFVFYKFILFTFFIIYSVITKQFFPVIDNPFLCKSFKALLNLSFFVSISLSAIDANIVNVKSEAKLTLPYSSNKSNDMSFTFNWILFSSNQSLILNRVLFALDRRLSSVINIVLYSGLSSTNNLTCLNPSLVSKPLKPDSFVPIE